MKTKLLNRRRFLTGAALGGSSLLLGGCDSMDSLVQSGQPVRNFLENVNDLTYRVQRMLMGRNALAKEYSQSEIRQPQKPNGISMPDDEDYLELMANGFSGFQLKIGGLVEKPLLIDRNRLFNIPARSQITRHDCVEGWSCIAEWTGFQLSEILKQARPTPQAKFVLFECYDTIERSLSGSFKYYETIDMIDAWHPQTILAYGLNGKTLPVENGAPLRLRVERQLGYKHAKYVHSITLISSFADIGGGKGGYWEDKGYDWYAGI